MKIIKILRWPEDKRKGIVPWFVIVRRLVFSPIIYIGIFVSMIGIFFGYGISKTKDFWENNK